MIPDAPSYDSAVALMIAVAQAQPVPGPNGLLVRRDVSEGSPDLALFRAFAAALAPLGTRQDAIVASLDVATATGIYLERLLAPNGVKRLPAEPASAAFLIAGSSATIPVGFTVPVYDQVTGQLITTFVTTQAYTLPFGGPAVWILAIDTVDLVAYPTRATAGNIPANSDVRLGTFISGVTGISNPPAAQPNAPTLTIPTLGAATRSYAIVGLGVTGTTTPSAWTTTMSAPNPVTGSQPVTLVWTPGTDGASTLPVAYAVLVSLDSGVTAGLLGTTTATTYTDTGAATTPYTLPLTNTSNSGVGGVNEESDDSLRMRGPLQTATRNGSTLVAIAGAVRGVDGVKAAYATNSLTPGIVDVAVVAASYPLTTAQQAAVQTAIDVTVAGGAQWVTLYIAPTPLTVSYMALAAPTVTSTDALKPAMATAVQAYTQTLAPGDPVRWSRVVAALMSVPGVLSVTSISLTAGGVTITNGDIVGATNTLYVVTTPAAVTGALTATS